MDDDLVFKALADRGRRTLLDRLHRSNGLNLGALCETLPMSRQAVSQHLEILEAANLVGTVWRGREKLHFLNASPIQEIYDRWMSKYQAHYGAELERLKTRLESGKRKRKAG
jgi:DNA-binding transcriptional ArsR family regulator